MRDESLIKLTPYLNRYALRLTRNKTDAEDLVSITVLHALEKIRSDESFYIEYPKSYLAKVMKHAFISNFVRRGKVAENSHYYDDWMATETPNQDMAAAVMDISKYLSGLDLYDRATIKKAINGQSALQISGNGYKTGISVVRKTINNFKNELRVA